MTPREYGHYKVAFAAGLLKESAGAQMMGGGGGGGGTTEYDMEPMDIKGSVKSEPKAEAKPKPKPKAEPKAVAKKEKGPAPKVKPKSKPDDSNFAAKATPGNPLEYDMEPMDIKGDFKGQADRSIADLGSQLEGLGPFAERATPGNPLEYDMEPMNIRGDAGGALAGGGEKANPFANLSYLDPFSDEAAFADVGGAPAAPAPRGGDRIDNMLASLNLGGGGGNF
jgi:hypothetical protein